MSLSRSLEYLVMVRHELVPLCQKIARRLKDGRDDKVREVALQQIESLENVDAVAKDAFAVLATEKVSSQSTLWKLRNFTATIFSQKFRQIKVLLKNFTRYN